MAEAPALLPPQDEGAEMSVVLSSMMDPLACTQAIGLLREEHFNCRPHRMVFRALVRLTEERQATDMVSVMSWLREQGRLSEWGSGEAFIKSFEGCAGVTSMVRAAGIIRDAWRMRELGTVAHRALGHVYGAYDAQDVLEDISARIFALAGDTPLYTSQSSASLAGEVMKLLSSSQATPSRPAGFDVQSGFPTFDLRVAGFANGSLTIVGARPAMGKTSLLLAFAVNAARAGEPVYFATCEMPNEQLMLRCACMLGSVSYQDVRKGRTNVEVCRRLFDALKILSALPITWDSLTAPTVPEVRAKVERIADEHTRRGKPLRLVLVDYMGKMRSTGLSFGASSEEKAANIVENCKNAAKKTDLPWILAAQLNRKVSEGGGKMRRPQMTDLRGSGVIENEADTIMFIHREDYAKEQLHGDNYVADHEAEIIVSKQRNGATATVTLRFIREYTRFEDTALDGAS